jgi:hypothetical protein
VQSNLVERPPEKYEPANLFGGMSETGNLHALNVVISTFQISGPAPLILDSQPEHHRRVRCTGRVRQHVLPF